MNQSFQEKLHEIIRVNHAGEFGAIVIYKGQSAGFSLKKDQKNLALVQKMKAQEEVHFEYFDQAIKKQKVRPTLMRPIWKIGGFALGFVTAMLDEKAAMTCTTAVEEVIDEHYQNQIQNLEEEKIQDDEIMDLKTKIEKFRQEELEHRDIGYTHKAEDLHYFKPLSFLIKNVTKLAINISKKV